MRALKAAVMEVRAEAEGDAEVMEATEKEVMEATKEEVMEVVTNEL